MARNSNTEHSRMLREKTAIEAYKTGTASGRIAQYSIRGNADMITEQLAVIDSMPGKSRAEKIQVLIRRVK